MKKVTTCKITCELVGGGTTNIGGGSSSIGGGSSEKWPDGDGKDIRPSV